ncbi:hypothetical protein Tco_0620563 [Tanacetum coccineum]
MLAKAHASDASSKGKVQACGSKAKLQTSPKTLIVKSPIPITNYVLGIANAKTWDAILSKTFGVKITPHMTCVEKKKGKRKISRGKKIVLSSDNSNDKKGPSKASVPIFKGPSVQGLLDGHGRRRSSGKDPVEIHHIKQTKHIKDPVEIHHIKQRDGESMEDFMERYKAEVMDVEGAPECMRISRFMHGITHPGLIKRLYERIPRSMDEMYRMTTSFLQGEVAAFSHGRRKASSSWKQPEGRGTNRISRKASKTNKDWIVSQIDSHSLQKRQNKFSL